MRRASGSSAGLPRTPTSGDQTTVSAATMRSSPVSRANGTVACAFERASRSTSCGGVSPGSGLSSMSAACTVNEKPALSSSSLRRGDCDARIMRFLTDEREPASCRLPPLYDMPMER